MVFNKEYSMKLLIVFSSLIFLFSCANTQNSRNPSSVISKVMACHSDKHIFRIKASDYLDMKTIESISVTSKLKFGEMIRLRLKEHNLVIKDTIEKENNNVAVVVHPEDDDKTAFTLHLKNNTYKKMFNLPPLNTLLVFPPAILLATEQPYGIEYSVNDKKNIKASCVITLDPQIRK